MLAAVITLRGRHSMNVITYQLKLEDGRSYAFEIDIDRQAESSLTGSHAAWTQLENNRCANCPLDPAQASYCPAAVDIEDIAAQFVQTLSIQRADVWVHTRQRSYFKNTDSQTFLNSIFGVIMASSACPILARLKPLAYFHLPFANLEETFHRLVGAYLVKQYLGLREGDAQPDWELKGLEQLYAELKTVNIHFMKRLRTASKEDASINALQSYVSLTHLVGMGVDDVLGKMLPLLRKGF
ncbi:MAG: hypothetical protein AB1450_11965 [Pseudomonadota bacterium]